MLNSSFPLLWMPLELWNPSCPRCPELRKHTNSSWHKRSTEEQKDTSECSHSSVFFFFTLPQTSYTRSLLSLSMNFWYPQGPCLPWLCGNAWEPRSCNKTWLTGSPAALSTMRTFSHSHSSPVYYKGTGGWSLSHHALCQKETLRSGRHPSLGSLFVLLCLTWMPLDCGIETWALSEKLKTLHRMDRAREVETSCCVSTVLTNESPWFLTGTTYQCHRVKTE